MIIPDDIFGFSIDDVIIFCHRFQCNFSHATVSESHLLLVISYLVFVFYSNDYKTVRV